MPNGEMLDALKGILEGDESLPQSVTNIMVLSAVRETYRSVGELRESLKSGIDALACRVDKIEQALVTDQAVHRETDKDKLTASGLWANYGRDILKLIIALLIGYIAAKAGAVP